MSSHDALIHRGMRRGLAIAAELLGTFVLGRIVWLAVNSPSDIATNLQGVALVILVCFCLLSFGVVAWRGRPFEGGPRIAWSFLALAAALALLPLALPSFASESAGWLLYAGSAAALLVGWNQIRRLSLFTDEDGAA